MTYIDLQYPTPQELKDKYKNQSALIIGTGHSTQQLLKYKNKLKSKFDILIGLNFATKDFEELLDFHFIIEKNPKIIYSKMIQEGKYRRNLPRILNWKAIDKFPKDIPIYKATRCNFGGKPSITDYVYNKGEGFLIGPQDSKGLSVGSVALQALHFACMMGLKDIYLSGVDLLFKNEFDHYYSDSHYRKSKVKAVNRSPIVRVKHNGKEYETTEFFRESAKYIDIVIDSMCSPIGIRVFDFSDGLISKANKVDFDAFFGEK